MKKQHRSGRLETYDEALRRLALLQSNKTIVNLFGSGTGSGSDDPTSSSSKSKTTKDLNALAMPEMLAWLSRAGYTPSSLTASGLRCAHVAGTKGKGSVSTLVSSILTEYVASTSTCSGGGGVGDNNQVGLYTSPHVLSVRERIQLNGEPISREKFTTYFFELWDRLSQAAREAGDLLPASGSIQSTPTIPPPQQQQPPSDDAATEGKGEEEGEVEDAYDGPLTKPFYFRFLTLLAFHVFVRERVRWAVIECGIGGEYDPTNVLEPETVTASVITQLGIDHVSMLGDTVPKIAWHKAGIFKRGVKGFTRGLDYQSGNNNRNRTTAKKEEEGEEGKQVMDVLRQRADEKGAASLEVVEDSEVESWWDGQVGAEMAREASLQGPFQKYNMALAARAAREHLIRTGVLRETTDSSFAREGKLRDLPEEFIRGLKRASLRGRCEVVREERDVGSNTSTSTIDWLIDGAHTEDSLRGVGEWFGGKVRQSGDEEEVRVLLFNQQDRDPGVLVRSLLAGVSTGVTNDKKKKKKTVFTHAIFTRNEEYPPSEEDEKGPPRDLSVQEKARDAFLEVVTGEQGNENEGSVEIWTKDAVVPSIELIREIISREGGKKGKVLVTGSFHLVGAVLKNIADHVEY